MAGDWVSNRYRREKARRACFAMWGTVCHLCGREGATTADHLVTRKQIRELGLDIDEFDPENLRPAHSWCNKSRGAGPVKAQARKVVVADGW